MVAADPEANIFQAMRADDRATLRASMIDLILGTRAAIQLHNETPELSSSLVLSMSIASLCTCTRPTSQSSQALQWVAFIVLGSGSIARFLCLMIGP